MRELVEQGRLPLSEALAAARAGGARGVDRAGRRRISRARWPGDRTRVAGRDRGDRARPARLAAPLAADEAWSRATFELSFGLAPDPERSAEPARPGAGGRPLPAARAIDCIDEHRQTGVLRVTDHKTGKDRTRDTLIIGGGERAAAGDLRRGGASGCSACRWGSEAVLLHVGRRLQQRPVLLDADAAAGDRSAGGDRSRRRAGHAGAGAGRGGLHLVRVPPGVRPGSEQRVARKPQARSWRISLAEEPP